MIQQVVAIRYAKAYLAYCQNNNSLKEIVVEAEEIIDILSNNPILGKTLRNKIISNQTKKKILLSICVNAGKNLRTLIEILVRKNRLYLFNDLLLQFIKIYKSTNGIETCYLISAEKISKKIQDNLKHVFKKIIKNKINIINIIDKDLIGGFIVKFGDLQFDNSVNSSLNKLKTSLKKGNTHI